MKKEHSKNKKEEKDIQEIKEKSINSEQQNESSVQFYPSKIPVSKPMLLEELKKFYEEELVRKDKIIEDLKKERDLLMRTAMKQSERTSKLNALLSGRGNNSNMSNGNNKKGNNK